MEKYFRTQKFAPQFPVIFNLTSLYNPGNGFIIPVVQLNSELGLSLAQGDINGDGRPDLIVGADGFNNTQGIVYVVYGQIGNFPTPFNLETLDGTNGFFVPGLSVADFLGTSVKFLKDINGDNVDDLIMGGKGVPHNTYQGAAYIIYGKTGGSFATPLI